MGRKEPMHVLVLAGTKGGVGKTTLASILLCAPSRLCGNWSANKEKLVHADTCGPANVEKVTQPSALGQGDRTNDRPDATVA